MRSITTHHTNECNRAIAITADDLHADGASHHYRQEILQKNGLTSVQHVSFQDGPIAEVGTNGTTHEALTAILIDRLECYQAGPYACEENRRALNHYREALSWLNKRTQQRVERGVEGTHEV